MKKTILFTFFDFHCIFPPPMSKVVLDVLCCGVIVG
jgi:hypothetical protein